MFGATDVSQALSGPPMEPIDPRDKHTDPTSNESRAPRVVALGRKAETDYPVRAKG
jgi:hypothetical protein